MKGKFVPTPSKQAEGQQREPITVGWHTIYNICFESNKKINTHLNYLMMLMPRWFAIEAKCLVPTIEAVHVAFVSGCVDMCFAYGEECDRQ